MRWRVFLLVPPVAVLLAWAITGEPRSALWKPMLECLALFVTGGFGLLCLLRWALGGGTWFVWATGLMAVLMGRELRFPGSSELVYLGLAGLGWIALQRFEAFRERLAHPALLTGLATGFFVYATSVAVDQRWLRGLPAEEVWQMPLEETLEVLGHAIIGATLLWSPRLRPPDRPGR